ncbi:hypothetical protein Acy02nite_49410 [Actinoplanes cyaneus]|uniref:Excalibur calcium-binding domain-containing protein n=1 Tax=Actinoplanes cyaneus TaxID=52696 RepID=A0A919IS48_9ACTN|nr:hypothetical protein [Actinoplanes cyaneus]MCW2140999.1 hypothetical protein [Actinoplanes cyaneus]GID67060.1 hypothetical protein Acy02nite_49410 [Actinoplanes cyaneus]
MSRLRYTGIAVAALALGGAAAWTVVTTHDAPAPSFVTAPAAEQGALPAATPSGRRSDHTDRAGHRAVAPVPAAPATSPGTAAGRPRTHGTPAPFVQTFAAQPGRARIKPGKSPKTPVRVAPMVDGCDRNYGTKAQCVPINYPKGVTDRCAWLTAHGFTRVAVVGKDRQHLDPDHDKIACD